ncbi:hypothetical protein IJ380_00640 [Candidatus Saccharibacteria bacterium]|nr:hypothetical protein [Candidatus Saccharibacteria bacterium]
MSDYSYVLTSGTNTAEANWYLFLRNATMVSWRWKGDGTPVRAEQLDLSPSCRFQ